MGSQRTVYRRCRRTSHRRKQSDRGRDGYNHILTRHRRSAMDRRTFVLGTAAAAMQASRLIAWHAAAVELGSIDGSVGGNQFTPAQFLDYLSTIKLTWAMISLPAAVVGDEAAIRQIRDHADRLGIKLQLAHGSVCPSSRSFNPQLGTLEEQVGRALKASQIFGAKCMRCILG